MPSRDTWKPVLKATIGFVAGLALWWVLSPPYGRLVSSVAGPLLHLFERPDVTRLSTEGQQVIIDRVDFPRRSARPTVPLADLTFNVILLTALFAASRQTFSSRNVSGFLLALAVLFATHILALVVSVQSTYALKLGPWSLAKYGPFARNFWSGTEHFYRLVGMYGIAFALWWLFRPSGIRLGSGPVPRKRRRRR